MSLVVIDPGHGGVPGAIGRDPWLVREASVAWAVSLATSILLEDEGVPTLMTRRQGEAKALRARANLANQARAAVFISIHCNSHEDPRANGIEVLHYGSERGEALAEIVFEMLSSTKMGDVFKMRGLVVRQRLTVLKATKMPAIMVELPFMSNAGDLTRLSDAYWQRRLARAIAFGALQYLNEFETR